MDEAVCRSCGATVAIWELRDAAQGGGCARCEGSPLCERCGHPRSEHSGVYAGARQRGCKVKIFALEDLAVSRCGCSGYQRATAPLAQAAFATEDVPVVDTAIPELRVIDPP